jgi:hypothetical protein
VVDFSGKGLNVIGLDCLTPEKLGMELSKVVSFERKEATALVAILRGFVSKEMLKSGARLLKDSEKKVLKEIVIDLNNRCNNTI